MIASDAAIASPSAFRQSAGCQRTDTSKLAECQPFSTNSILSQNNTKVKFFIQQNMAKSKVILGIFQSFFLVLNFSGLYNLNMNSRTQIIATIGKASEDIEILKNMALSGMDIARLNFSWGNFEEKERVIDNIKKVEGDINMKIYILADLPGPRVQDGKTHTYDKNIESSFTDEDREL
jgi:hypothetical protein